jgi:hypothetical protein
MLNNHDCIVGDFFAPKNKTLLSLNQLSVKVIILSIDRNFARSAIP